VKNGIERWIPFGITVAAAWLCGDDVGDRSPPSRTFFFFVLIMVYCSRYEIQFLKYAVTKLIIIASVLFVITHLLRQWYARLLTNIHVLQNKTKIKTVLVTPLVKIRTNTFMFLDFPFVRTSPRYDCNRTKINLQTPSLLWVL